MATLKTLQNGQTGLAFRTDLNENFGNINTDLTNLEIGYNSVVVHTNTPEGVKNLPLGPTPENVSLVDYELFDSEITEIRTQESNIIKGDYLTQGSGVSLTKSESGVSISIDDNLPYIKSVNGNGTGTTNLENIIVTGDSVLTDVNILKSIHVPEPKSSTEAATKSYVDSHSGGGGANPELFIVNFTKTTTNNYSSDKTIQEIEGAVTNNKIVIGIAEELYGRIFTLSPYDSFFVTNSYSSEESTMEEATLTHEANNNWVYSGINVTPIPKDTNIYIVKFSIDSYNDFDDYYVLSTTTPINDIKKALSNRKTIVAVILNNSDNINAGFYIFNSTTLSNGSKFIYISNSSDPSYESPQLYYSEIIYNSSSPTWRLYPRIPLINFSTFEDNIGNLTYYYMFTPAGISMSIRNSGTAPVEISNISLQGKANTTFSSMLSSFDDNGVKLSAKVGDSTVEYSSDAMLTVSPTLTIQGNSYIDMTFNPIWRYAAPV